MLKKILNISCKRASYLASKKEAGTASFLDKLKLKLHYKICSGCRRFAEQTTFIGKKAKQTHNHESAALSKEKKDNLKNLLKNQKIELLLAALALAYRYGYMLEIY
jgi:hypothetical protein